MKQIQQLESFEEEFEVYRNPNHATLSELLLQVI
jgi:hypothetical protein